MFKDIINRPDNELVIQPIVLPPPYNSRNKLCFSIDDVFSKEECEAVRRRVKKIDLY